MDVRYTKDGKRIKLTKTELAQIDAVQRTLDALAENKDKEAQEAGQLLVGLRVKYREPVLVGNA